MNKLMYISNETSTYRTYIQIFDIVNPFCIVVIEKAFFNYFLLLDFYINPVSVSRYKLFNFHFNYNYANISYFYQNKYDK